MKIPTSLLHRRNKFYIQFKLLFKRRVLKVTDVDGPAHAGRQAGEESGEGGEVERSGQVSRKKVKVLSQSISGNEELSKYHCSFL